MLPRTRPLSKKLSVKWAVSELHVGASVMAGRQTAHVGRRAWREGRVEVEALHNWTSQSKQPSHSLNARSALPI